MTIRTIAIGLLILTITLVAPIGSATTLHRHPLTEGIATIAVKVNGISLRMLVDTGAQRSLSKGMNLSTPLNEEAALLPASRTLRHAARQTTRDSQLRKLGGADAHQCTSNQQRVIRL